ncbi:hypothetical protein HPP92_006863 [Vanilla planifolia]|uniref:Uncharacterized protein n=1 Tax=Vanilla planifolia TaxID=51239 RepID=A0A835V933_VANPL|nr:hypothetical protein HPP92_007101 [Vanilla planifolia]KAG0490000.1 hypothetical protein HPP92_006863 [Vanilla planifolia]
MDAGDNLQVHRRAACHSPTPLGFMQVSKELIARRPWKGHVALRTVLVYA